jgi:hypothetical protein
MKRIFLLIFLPLFLFTQILLAESMYSPTWGFFVDLPEGYEYIDGDGRDRFSFAGPSGLMFDLIIYNNRYNSLQSLTEDVNRRLNNRGDVDFFLYNGKRAAIIKLMFDNFDGWGLAIEIGNTERQNPMLLALAYGPSNRTDLEIFNISALDSISPSSAELLYPGPIMEYAYPRGELQNVTLANGINVTFRQNDAEASQDLIEREFAILQQYLHSPYLLEASIRYYRFIYRDSYDRIINAVETITHHYGGSPFLNDAEKRAFAQRILSYIQNFIYERDFSGSDFLNLVTAITESRGDCDNRAMLFAIILSNTNIRSAIMVSYHHGHAMGLADVQGSGARFESYGTHWLVAETTAFVDIGMIAQDQSDPQHWFAIIFE